MSFQFRYDSLLRARNQERDQQARVVARTTAQIVELEQESIQWQRQIDCHHRDSSKKRTGVVKIASLIAAEQQAEYLSQRLAQCHSAQAALTRQLTDQRKKLVQAQLELKRMEVLRDGELAAHRSNQQRKNQQETDDINNASRHFRPAV